MLIQRIKISNFKTYLSLDLDLTVDDDRPIILIGGSNGGGKTTLFEAISGALYGLKIESKEHFMELLNQGPNNSMNAPLVPDPSSRDNTLTYSLASKSVVAAGASSAVVSAAASVEASAVVSADVLVSAVLSEPHPAIMLTANIPVTNKLITFFFILIFLQIFMGSCVSHLCFFVSVSLTMTTLKPACKI